VYTVKEKEGKPDRKPYPLPYEIYTETSSLTLKIMPRNLNEIVSSRIWLLYKLVKLPSLEMGKFTENF
jgi:hypothetical protein